MTGHACSTNTGGSWISKRARSLKPLGLRVEGSGLKVYDLGCIVPLK